MDEKNGFEKYYGYARAGVRSADVAHSESVLRHEDVEDLIGEALLKFHKTGYRDGFPIKTIAFNHTVDELRRKKLPQGSTADFAELPSEDDEDEDNSSYEIVEFVLRHAPPPTRQILEAIYLRRVDVNSKSLAAATGLSPQTVRRYLSDARAAINDALLHTLAMQIHKSIASGDASLPRLLCIPTPRRKFLCRAAMHYTHNFLLYAAEQQNDEYGITAWRVYVQLERNAFISGVLPTHFAKTLDPSEIYCPLSSFFELRLLHPPEPGRNEILCKIYKLLYQFAQFLPSSNITRHRSGILRFTSVDEETIKEVEQFALDELASVLHDK